MINSIHHHHDISLSPHAPLDTAAATTKPPTDSILRLRSTHYKKPAMESRSLQLGTSPLARVSRQSHVRCKTNMAKCGPSIVPEPCGHVARHETIRRTMWLWENSCLGCGLRGNHWDPWLLWFWSPQVFSAAGFNPESQSSPWCLWCLLILYIYMEHNLWTNQARIASWLQKMGKCFIFQQFHAIPTIGSLIISAGLVGCHRFSAPGSKSDQVLWGPQADLVSASRIRPFAAASLSF